MAAIFGGILVVVLALLTLSWILVRLALVAILAFGGFILWSITELCRML